MAFNSVQFIVFLIGAYILFCFIPKVIRKYYILVVSFLFYVLIDYRYLLLLLAISTFNYLLSIIIFNYREKLKLISVLAIVISIIIDITILVFFKYGNMFVSDISIVLPIGISFYVFKIISYIIDVYKGKINVSYSIFDFILYTSYFPEILSGPIDRFDKFKYEIDNLRNVKILESKRIESSIILIVWGFFLKIVIADRAGILVDSIYGSYELYGGIELIIATFVYAIQIYCDFSSYSIIALGVSRLFGIAITENFSAPYLETSVGGFWKKWHISLYTWLRDYIYFPLGGSRCCKFRHYINIIIVFLISGIWHGNSLTYIIWGSILASYIILGDMTSGIRLRLCNIFNINIDSFSHKLWKTIVTFILISFSWIFFRANTINDAHNIIRIMYTNINPWVFSDGTITKLALSASEMNILVISVIIMFLVDLIRHNKRLNIDEYLFLQSGLFRYIMIILFIIIIIIFGSYSPDGGAENFIYGFF